MEISVCYCTFIPMRSEPSEKSELVSQVLFGEQMDILETDKTRGFTRVRNLFDNYEGWCNSKLIKKTEPSVLKALNTGKTFITRDIITSLKVANKIFKFYLGAGSTVYLNEDKTLAINGETYILPVSFYTEETISPEERILASAKKFINIPYLWGGRSSFGTDCSGFVQNVFKQAGISLPRDAKQQAEKGIAVDFFNESLPGDIMFFDNEEGNIVHTGIYIGNHKIIHASGRVKTDSIDHQGIFDKEAGKYTHKLRIVKRVI